MDPLPDYHGRIINKDILIIILHIGLVIYGWFWIFSLVYSLYVLKKDIAEALTFAKEERRDILD